jgi:hypothetical protein
MRAADSLWRQLFRLFLVSSGTRASKSTVFAENWSSLGDRLRECEAVHGGTLRRKALEVQLLFRDAYRQSKRFVCFENRDNFAA